MRVYVTLYNDEGRYNEFVGAYATLGEAKAGGNRHFRRYRPGEPKWENTGGGAKAVHHKAQYDVQSIEITPQPSAS